MELFKPSLVRGLIYGLIMAAYMRYFGLPFLPALGLMLLGDVLRVLLQLLLLPAKPKETKP
jgi:hypothetical protein